MSEMQVWTEKYRPQKLDEVIDQKHVVERLKAWVKAGSIPNMIFAGRAGTGKTTIALCLAKELFGKYWRENFQETNASDERGIDIVRNKIKDFARTKPLESDFKIVFLDEADALTSDAQQALRRTIEKYSGICRFILNCNYSSRLIEPIQSRATVFRFKGLNEEHVKEYLKRISNGEKLKADDDGLHAIYELSEGDLRKATNMLQASAALGEVTKKTVYDVAMQAKPKDIKNMLDLAVSGKFSESRKKLYDIMINQGLSGEDIIKGMHKEIFSLEIDEKKRLEMIKQLGEYEFRLNQGANPDIQLIALLAQFS